MNAIPLKKNVIGVTFAWLFTFLGLAVADPVEVRYATEAIFPCAPGCYYTLGQEFELLVDNIAYEKVVGIWGHGYDGWRFYPGKYFKSVPGNREIWKVTTGNSVGQFVARYEVGGNTYWDNNNGNDYMLGTAQAPNALRKMVGKPNVVHQESYISSSGDLIVSVDLKDLAYQKEVGIVYSTDDWGTAHTALGYYEESHLPSDHPGQPQAETWRIEVPVGDATSAEFSVFYKVDGNTYWDNNFGRNFTATNAYTP